MKELYKLYSSSVTNCLSPEKAIKEDNGILEKYLATKKNFQTLRDRTSQIQKSIEEKCKIACQNNNTHEASCFESDQFKCNETFYNDSKENICRSVENESTSKSHENNEELEKSIEYINEAFRRAKRTIKDSATNSKMIECEKSCYNENISPCESQEKFQEESYDKPKENCDDYKTVIQTSVDSNSRVERILKLIELHAEPSMQEVVSQPSVDCRDLRSPFDVCYWDKEFQKYSYYAFIILVCTLLLLSVLRTTYFAFQAIKKYFDKALLYCWSWVRVVFTPSSPSNEPNVVMFIVLTPFIILLLIAYSGFSILYFVNKVLLMRVPRAFPEQYIFRKVEN